MSSSREESPDWVRSFQAPTHTAVTLSSGSEPSPVSSPIDSPTRVVEMIPEKRSPKETSPVPENKDQDTVYSEGGKVSAVSKISKAKSPRKQPKASRTPVRKNKTESQSKSEAQRRGGKAAKQEAPAEHVELQALNHSVWTLSSDSDSCPDIELKEENDHKDECFANKLSQYPHKEVDEDSLHIDSVKKSPLKEVSKGTSPKKRLKTEDEMPIKKKTINNHPSKKEIDGDMAVTEKEVSEKFAEPHLTSSRLPLVLSEKVHRSKALVECEGDSIDLSGDMGSVGRVVISDDSSRNHEMLLDLKGTIYRTNIIPSRTFCVVSVGQSEAKIEAIMNDFIQLRPLSNVYEAETMVEGTLEGFSFDSEDETDKVPKTNGRQADENEGAEEQPNGKSKSKSEKLSGTARKRGKATAGKLPKKVKRKTQASKRTKTKK